MYKNSFSLIKDWYFCCCLGCSPRTSTIFLSSLEYLDNPETDKKLKSISLEQIFCLDDTSMQIYALPQVLFAFQRKFENAYSLNEIDKENTFNFYSELIDKLSTVKVGKILKQFLNLCLYPEVGAGKLLEILKLRDFILTPIINEPLKAPYRDIQNYEQESLLSVFICYLAYFNEHFRQFLNSEKGSEFEHFFTNSLNGNYGRFTFGQIFSLPSEMHRYENAGKNLWNGRLSNIPEFEPDILTWYADLEFIKPFEGKINQAVDVSKVYSIGILNEIQILERLIDKINIKGLLFDEGEFNLRKNDINNFLNKTGINAKQPKTRQGYVLSIPFIFWQNILIVMLVKVDPGFAYEKLSKLFTQNNQNTTIKVKGPDPKLFDKLKCIYSNLGFYKIKDSSLPRVEWAGYSEKLIIDEGNWMITTPNLCINKDAIDRGEFTCFYKYELSPSLIGLSFLCVPTIRLIQQREKHSNSGSYLGILVHTEALFRIYKDWLTCKQDHQFLNFKGHWKLSYPLTGLISASRRALHMVGCGSSNSIAPELFVADLKSRIQNIENANTNSEKYFADYIYPGILFAWIQNAVTAFSDKNGGQERWRILIKEVYGYYKREQLGVASPYNKTEIALLLRMFVPSTYANEDFLKDINWKEFLKKYPDKSEKISSRNFLTITNDIKLSDWYSDAFFTDVKDNDNANMIRIIRAVEGLTLIMIDKEFNEDEAIRAFYNDFEYLTQKIAEKKQIDRYLRIRLLDFIDVLEKFRKNNVEELSWGKLQELTVYLLFEFGTPYELGVLINKIFPFDSEGNLPGEADYQHLQEMTVNAFCRMTAPQLTNHQVYKIVENPFDKWIVLQKNNLIKEKLNLIGYAYWMAKKNGNSLFHLNLSGKYNELVFKYAIESTSGYEEIFRGECIPRENRFKINTIIYNPNRKFVRLFTDTLELVEDAKNNTFYNFFETSKVPSGANEIKALAFISTIVNDKISFNCGLNKLFTITSLRQNIVGLYEGMQVIVKLSKTSNTWTYNGFEKCIPQSNSKIKKIEINGSVILAELRDKSKNCKEDRLINDLKSEWFPDLYWMSNSDFLTNKEVDLEKNTDFIKKYIPINQYLESLLTADTSKTEIVNQSRQIGFTLTFVRKKTSLSSIDNGYVFSSGPGKLFHLYPDDFTNEALEILMPKLEYEENKGLLVTFIPCLDNAGLPKLSLPIEAENISSNERYAKLKAPFDFRNIELFNLFTNDTDENYLFTAIYKNDIWILGDNIGDISFDIRVKFEEDPFPGIDEIQFVKTDWDPYTRVVKGKIDTRINLELINNSYNYLFSIRKGGIVNLTTLNIVIGRDISVQTGEGFEVIVPFYTLTMQPLEFVPYNDKTLIKAIKDRKAVIEHAFENRIGQIEIDFLNNADPQFKKAIVIGKSGTDRSSFTIWWEGLDTNRSFKVEIKFVNKKDDIRLGDIIYNINGDFELKRWRIFANAIWNVDNSIDNKSLVYIGETRLENKDVYLVESKNKPGSLMIFNLYPGVGHLAESNNNGQFRATPENLNSWNLSNSFYINNNNENETIFLNKPNKRITGIINGYLHRQSATQLDKVQINVRKINEGLLLTRYFELEAPLGKESKTLIGQRISTGNLIRNFRENQKTFMIGECQIKDSKVNCIKVLEGFQIPVTTIELDWEAEANWTNRITLKEGESIYINSRINIYDTNDCLFSLVPCGNQGKGYLASFRNVKPNTLIEFKERKYQNILRNNEKLVVKRRLFYDGFYDNTDFEKDFPKGNGPYFLFEYGFGKTLCIPDTDVYIKQLTNEIEPLQHYTNFLFHGDEISDAEILKQNKKWILIINSVNIEPCEAQVLYKQSIEHVVHLLYYDPEQDKITRITGLGNKGDTVENKFFHTGATLSVETKKNLVGKIDEWRKTGKREIPLYARINLIKFSKTGGRILEYNCLNMCFEHGPKIFEDLNNLWIFVKGLKIRQGHNDFFLDIRPIMDSDLQIPDEFKRMSIKRRDFSCDEETLARYWTTNQELSGQIFLVKINIYGNGEKRDILVKIIDDRGMDSMQLRHERHLDSCARGREQTYLTYFQEINNFIILEYKPGIFFKINKNNWSLPQKLNKGDLLKINIDNTIQEMKLASFGDEYYISNKPRSIVLLPMNYFGKKNLCEIFQKKDGNDLFKDRDNLTVGSFPNLILSFWNGISYSKVFEMMLNYYKFAQVSKNKEGKLRLEEIIKHNEGRIKWEILSPMKVSMKYGEPREELEALSISFMDKLLSDIFKRTTDIFWNFHDRTTPVWKKIVDRISTDEKSISRNSSFNGPIFFHQQDRKFILRYPEVEKRNFGYPVREILHFLQEKPNKQEVFYFAGLTNDDQNERVGIWVEMTPGRIVEIPVDLLLIKIEDKKINSSGFDWSLFSFGDELHIKLDQIQGQERDQLILEKWVPGARGLLGRGCVYTPVQMVHISEDLSVQNGISIGNGIFELILPYNKKIEKGTRIKLNLESNELELIDFESHLHLEQNAIVFLKWEEEILKISGWEDYIVEIIWTGWESILNSEIEDNQSLKLNDLKEIITVLGLLPVTVEEIILESNIIRISRRLQQLPNGISCLGISYSIGHIVEQKNSDKIIVRFGNNLVTIGPEQIIEGLDNIEVTIRERIVKLMNEQKSNLELCCQIDNRNIKAGVPGKSELGKGDIAKVFLRPSGGSGIIFMMPNSMELFYVSPEHSVFCKPTDEILKRAFLRGEFSPVIYTKDNVYSIVKSHIITEWYNKLKINDKFEVNVIFSETNGDKKLCIVKHKNGVIAVCDYFTSAKLDNTNTVTVILTDKYEQASLPKIVLKGGDLPFELDYPFDAVRDDDFQLLDNNWNGFNISSEVPLDEITIVKLYSKFILFSGSELDIKLMQQVFSYLENIKNENKTISVLPCLCAISLIFRSITNNWITILPADKQKSSAFLQYLRLRFMRNLHVEILSKEASPDWTQVNGGMKERFNIVAKRIKLNSSREKTDQKSTFNDEEISKIRTFRKSVYIKEEMDLLPNADALIACLGELESNTSFMKEDLLLNDLVKICNILPQGDYLDSIDASELWTKISVKTDEIIGAIKQQKRFIPLLPFENEI